MKKILLILSLIVMTINVNAKKSNKLIETVNENMILNKRIKKVEGIKKVVLGEANNLISIIVKKDIKNIDIDIFDEEEKRIINQSMIDGLSMLERGGVSEITLNSFESEGKLFLEFNNIERDEEISIEISFESEGSDAIDDIIDIEYME